MVEKVICNASIYLEVDKKQPYDLTANSALLNSLQRTKSFSRETGTASTFLLQLHYKIRQVSPT